MKSTHCIAHWLVMIGGLNWGLIGLGYFMGSSWNLIKYLIGQWPSLEALVYLLVGLSAVYMLTTHKKHCKTCGL